MRDEGLSDGSRSQRWVSVVGLAGRRVLGRATGTDARRTWLSIASVAVAIALMLVVTSVGLGLASKSTVRSDGVDYWVLPESGTAATTVVSTSGPNFGNVHEVGGRIREYPAVDHTTPVLVQVVRMRSATGDGAEYVLALGIVPSDGPDTIGGVSPEALSDGDPYFANGSYDGEWTGDVVLSPAATTLLNASAGTRLGVFSTNSAVAGNPLSVTNVSEGEMRTGIGQIPVALFRLSELQALTGAAAGDQADQMLVSTDSPAMKGELEGLYPDSTVVTRTGLTSQQVTDADLPLAVALSAFVVALIVGTLFVATTMALEIRADRQEFAVLAAIGFRRSDRALFVVSQTLCLTLLGGTFGVLAGALGIKGTNYLVGELFVPARVALFHPALVIYGLGVSLLVGLLAAPYLLVVTRRTTTLEGLTR